MRIAKLFQIPLISLALLLAVPSHAQLVKILHSFSGVAGSASPYYMMPTQGLDGNVYGTAYSLNGSIFESGATGQFDTLYTFAVVSGADPIGGLTLGSDGSFYGAAQRGGSASDGVLFKFTLPGTYTVLHDFQGGSDGLFPESSPIQASDGNLYGTTFGQNGGPNSTIYKYDLSTSTFTTLYQFDGTHGLDVVAPLIEGADGNLFGTALSGGPVTTNCGTIFKITTSGALLWYYSFPGNQGGCSPTGPLIQASDGNYYGTTTYAGVSSSPGDGVIFKLDQNGIVSVFHNFAGYPQDGANSVAALTQGSDGKLYGVTAMGGKSNFGSIFQITLGGAYKMLYSFPMFSDPFGTLLQDTSGLFYGTTVDGGAKTEGTLYSLNVHLAPFVTFVQSTGGIGATAQILGQGFTGTVSVTFNGVPATSFAVVSDTYVTAVVPSGATTGRVVVTTPTGALTSNRSFRISH